ncbi:MAG: VOC family protein [Arachnia sp.]
MAVQLNPYLTFEGSCAAAIDFYAQALGGVPAVSTFREFGLDTDGVMHAALDTPDGFHIFASDMVEGMGPKLIPGNDMQMSISGDDDAKLRGFWDALSDGGEIVMPLERQPWGADYGLFVDRFGVSWHVNITPAE